MGITPKVIFVKDVEHTVLSGSNTANDQFFVTNLDSHLVLYGNGGADRFIIGHGNGRRDLSFAGRVVNIAAGEGNDYVRVDDSNSDHERFFRVRQNWIHETGNSPTRLFWGVSFTGVPRVDLTVNQFTDRVLISPSTESAFIIKGGRPGKRLQDIFFLVPPINSQRQFIPAANGNRTRFFDANTLKSIFVQDTFFN